MDRMSVDRGRVGDSTSGLPRKRASPPPLLRPLPQKTSLGMRAVDAIKALIVEGKLQPGDALPAERELAVMLGISRPSVREAIRALSSMNILTSRHGGGTFVTSLDPSLLAQPISFLLQIDETVILNLFEVRRVLEVEAARIAALRITDDELDALLGLVNRGGRLLNRPTLYLKCDFAIHAAVIEATQNPLYVRLYESVSELSLESRRRTATVASTREQAHEDHIGIARALRGRDADAAGKAMHDHLTGVEHAFRRRITTEGHT